MDFSEMTLMILIWIITFIPIFIFKVIQWKRRKPKSYLKQPSLHNDGYSFGTIVIRDLSRRSHLKDDPRYSCDTFDQISVPIREITIKDGMTHYAAVSFGPVPAFGGGLCSVGIYGYDGQLFVATEMNIPSWSVVKYYGRFSFSLPMLITEAHPIEENIA